MAEINLERMCSELYKKLDNSHIPHRFNGIDDFNMINDIWHKEQSIQNVFPTLELFLNYLLQWSYGLEFKQEEHLEEKALPKDVFAKRVDMFRLIEYLTHSSAIGHELRFAGICGPSAEFSRNDGSKVTLKGKVEENFWNNIFNNFANSKSDKIKDICIFNRGKHALASYLHSASEHFLYWNFRSEEDNTLWATAIVAYAKGRIHPLSQWRHYYLLEGVVADLQDFDSENKQKIYELIFSAIDEAKTLSGISMDSYGKEYGFFLNTAHPGYHLEQAEFLNYVQTKYNLSQKGVTHSMINRKGNTFDFTHEFYFPTEEQFIEKVTLFNQNGERLYHGEQYMETFYPVNKLEFSNIPNINAFFFPGGYAQGIGVNDHLNLGNAGNFGIQLSGDSGNYNNHLPVFKIMTQFRFDQLKRKV